MKKSELYWLAGFLEGEGSFMVGPPSKPNLPIISVVSTDKDVIRRCSNLFGNGYCKSGEPRSRKFGWKLAYVTYLKGYRAVLLMRLLKPLMGIRRKSQIHKALSSYKDNSHHLSPDIISGVKQDLKKGFSQSTTADNWGLCRETVCRINTGKII